MTNSADLRNNTMSAAIRASIGAHLATTTALDDATAWRVAGDILVICPQLLESLGMRGHLTEDEKNEQSSLANWDAMLYGHSFMVDGVRVDPRRVVVGMSAAAPQEVAQELPSLMSNRWPGADFWGQQGLRPALTLEDLLARSEVATVGIDGGGLDDLLGLAVIGRERETRRWLLWTRAWAHPSVMERRKSEAARFEDFAKQGDLVLVKRIGEDVEQVAAAVLKVEQSGLLDKVGCDSAGIGAILDAMVEAGVPQEKIVAISQGWRLGGAIKTTERKLAEGVIEHGGQPMMAWCVGNAKVVPRGNAILITKRASGSAKIDPLMAVFGAVCLMELNPPAQGGTAYESRAITAKAAS